MTIPARANVVTLGVRDLERSTAFYTALGWPLSPSSVPGEVSFFGLGNCVLALFGHDALADDASVERAEPSGFRAVALAVNVASPAEVDAALATAEEAGARVTKPGQPVFWGGYNGYFADPDGHLWEVAHNPHWPLDDTGSVHLPD
jgi:catechol 2,3-dioxygenase-like lactoylglutathione lyase family enzyme